MHQLIHKQPLQILQEQSFQLPPETKILKVAYQGTELFLWYQFDPWNANTEGILARIIVIFGTGHTFNDNNLVHIDTVVSPEGMVWHVFEKIVPNLV